MSIPLLTTQNPGGSPTTVAVTFYVSTVEPHPPAQLTAVLNTTDNPKFSRNVQTSNELIMIKRGIYTMAFKVADLAALAVAQVSGLTFAPFISTQPASVACAATASATSILTSDNTAPADGDTVTIGAVVYRFKDTMAQAYDVQRDGANADNCMNNLRAAINGTGSAGTEWYAGTSASPYVTAGTLAAHAFTVTAKTAGVAANLIATTETSAHLSFNHATLAGGTVAAANFAVVMKSELAATYLWEYSTDGGTTWATATGTIAGCAYTNGTTATLTCTPTTAGQTGKLHRCTITNAKGATVSESATLTIP